MTDHTRSYHAIECGHCGAKDRMRILGCVSDTQEHMPPDAAPFEAGVQYEVYLCVRCGKPIIAGGHWHDGMDDPADWTPHIIVPDTTSHAAYRLLDAHSADRKFMLLAVVEARKSVSEPQKVSPMVGAVVARNNQLVATGYRGELQEGDHAEYTVLERKCRDDILAGATVYTTLEPCTSRHHPKIPCVERLIGRKIGRVVIGMLDPDERIRGRGVLALRKANIHVDLFPPDLMMQLEEMNREFIVERERVSAMAAARASTTLSSPDIRGFVDMSSLYRYVIERIRSARTSIDDLTWGPDAVYDRTPEEKSLYKEYQETIKTATAFYREVMDISGTHRERARDVLSAQLGNHHLKRPGDRSADLPLLSFMVFDSSEVVFLYRPPDKKTSDNQCIGIAITEPQVVDVFKTYFVNIWEHSKDVTAKDVEP